MPVSKEIDRDRLAAFRKKLDLFRLAEERESCEDSLAQFLASAWPAIDSSEYQSGWAVDAMCDHLEAAILGYIPRLLINVPPRCSKTSLISIAFPAWVWAQTEITYLTGPQVQFLCASYGHTLSLDSSNKCRRVINSPWYQSLWGNRFKLRNDQNTKGHWENDRGGAYISTSVGGSLLGLGGAVLISDDLNNTEGVESDAERAQVELFWQEFHSTRLNDPKQSIIIVIQQRLHEHDVSGIILDSDEPFVHLCIPMSYESDRSYSTVKLPQYDDDEPWDDPRSEDGELMWPERFGEAEVRKLENSLGPYLAAGRLQQRPAPKGGGILKREWWQVWDKIEAAKYGLDWDLHRKEYPQFELVVASLDTAYGEKEENDYNAFTTWGIFIDRNGNRRALLVYAWRKRLPLHGTEVLQIKGEAKINYQDRQKAAWGLVEWVADTCSRYKVQRLLIENKSRGMDVANEIRRLYARDNWGVQLVNPVKDKISRAHSIVPLFTDSSIFAPESMGKLGFKWVDPVITECASFPKGEHDDYVDSVSQALLWLRQAGLLVRADEAEAEVAESSKYHGREQSVAERYGV